MCRTLWPRSVQGGKQFTDCGVSLPLAYFRLRLARRAAPSVLRLRRRRECPKARRAAQVRIEMQGDAKRSCFNHLNPHATSDSDMP